MLFCSSGDRGNVRCTNSGDFGNIVTAVWTISSCSHGRRGSGYLNDSASRNVIIGGS